MSSRQRSAPMVITRVVRGMGHAYTARGGQKEWGCIFHRRDVNSQEFRSDFFEKSIFFGVYNPFTTVSHL